MDEEEILSGWREEIRRRVLQRPGHIVKIAMDDIVRAIGTLPDKSKENELKNELCDQLEAEGLVLTHRVAGVPDAISLTSKGADPGKWDE